jgi:hypothetical protein
MALTIDEKSLKQGVLTLAITLVEVIQETLERQAVLRMEGGELTEDELNRLGEALLDLDQAIEQIKTDHGLQQSVADLRRGLDDVVDEVVDRLIDPQRWLEEVGR